MKKNNAQPKLVIVGSIALDTIATPCAKRSEILGGSVSYACAAASFFTRAGMVGVVGNDFPARHTRTFHRLGIDTQGLQKVKGRTFRWSGVYGQNLNTRRTLSTELNVFAAFSPELPPAYQKTPFLFLANIEPALQLQVLSQVKAARFVAADTMDLWIKTEHASLRKLISKVDLLLINDSEAEDMTGESHLIKAAQNLLRWGPRFIIIKKGEHGSMLFSKDGISLMPAYPVLDVKDPTGAGDAFAGGLLGALTKANVITHAHIKRAMIYGTITASFAVEAFSLDRLTSIGRAGIDKRLRQFQKMLA